MPLIHNPSQKFQTNHISSGLITTDASKIINSERKKSFGLKHQFSGTNLINSPSHQTISGLFEREKPSAVEFEGINFTQHQLRKNTNWSRSNTSFLMGPGRKT